MTNRCLETIAKSSCDNYKLLCYQKPFWNCMVVYIKWTNSHNFKSIVELVAACSREEIKKHLLHAPQRANYTLPEYISKYIQIIDGHIKLSLLASPCTFGPFTFLTMRLQMSLLLSKWPFMLHSTAKGLLKNIMWESFL